MSKNKTLIILLTAFIASFNSIAQLAGFEYINPLPGSDYIMPGNSIALRIGEPIKRESLAGAELTVTGSESGVVPGSISLSADARTLFFKPGRKYHEGEKITVDLRGELVTTGSGRAGNIQFSFTVTPKVIDINSRPDILEKINDWPAMPHHPPAGEKIPYNRNTNDDPTLPDDFPVIDIVKSNNPPEEGYYFMAPSWGGWVFPGAPAYLVIFDNYGTPVYYKKSASQNNNLSLQPNGKVTYHENVPYNRFVVLDNKMQQADIYQIQNGYTFTDHHEFILLPNGHAFVMTADAQQVDMDTVVPGGQPGATVVGFVFQELDVNKDVVFQWRSWDHFKITDVSEYEDLTAELVDYVHANSIEIESDTSLIISSRNMNEVTKIDRRTGEIIWRFGGENNQFTFVGDPLGFDYQHDARVLSDGNLSIFDNGQHHPDPKFSSGVEYEMDEENMTATLIRRWRTDPDIWAVIMGNMQEVETGGRVIGWGSGVPGITEFHADGSVALEVYFDNINYRAYRFIWETGAFDLSDDTIDFGEVYYQGTGKKLVEITNNLDTHLVINHVHSRTGYFEADPEELPMSISPGDNRLLSLYFYPDTIGVYRDVLTVCNNVDEEDLIRRIGKQVHVRAIANEEAGVEEGKLSRVIVGPNPSGRGIYTIRGIDPGEITNLSVISPSGEILLNKEQVAGRQLDLGEYPPGIYLLRITANDRTLTKKLIRL